VFGSTCLLVPKGGTLAGGTLAGGTLAGGTLVGGTLPRRHSAFGVFRWFEVAHFNDFFLSSHTVYLFRFVCCWLMSVAPKSS